MKVYRLPQLPGQRAQRDHLCTTGGHHVADTVEALSLYHAGFIVVAINGEEPYVTRLDGKRVTLTPDQLSRARGTP